MDSGKTSGETVAQSEQPLQEQKNSSERREAMRRIGGYAAYVAPAMLALVSTRNAAIS